MQNVFETMWHLETGQRPVAIPPEAAEDFRIVAEFIAVLRT